MVNANQHATCAAVLKHLENKIEEERLKELGHKFVKDYETTAQKVLRPLNKRIKTIFSKAHKEAQALVDEAEKVTNLKIMKNKKFKDLSEKKKSTLMKTQSEFEYALEDYGF